MQTYLIEPQTPLVFRGGKPFGAASREAARHPWPSSSAGAIRTAMMRASGMSPSEVLGHAVHGPYLFGASSDGDAWALHVPAPADAVRMRDDKDGASRLHRLAPGRMPEGSGADLPHGLAPVLLPHAASAGKAQAMATFWKLADLLAWDAGHVLKDDVIDASPSPFVHVDARTHLAIDRATLAADEGRLFQIQALDFTQARSDRGYTAQRWALGVCADADLSDRMLTLGGERGLAWLSRPGTDPLRPPAPHLASIAAASRVALTLVTPAPLARGVLPGWLGSDLCGEHPCVPGLRLRLQAIANKRWEGVSGWDLAAWQPRPLRRAAPMGSTYWFDIVERPPGEWASALWLASICDGARDRCDGWGIALPRTGAAINYTI